MSQIEKLEQRLLSRPKDFTFQEAEKLLRFYGHVISNRGKTSGSRVKFIQPGIPGAFYLHKPHPGNVLQAYQVDDLIVYLMRGGFLK